MLRYSSLLILSIFIGFQSFAQDRIILLSGKTIELKSYTINDEYVFYNRKDDTRSKQRLLEKMDVFSILKSDSSEIIIYKDDTINGLSIEQVRNYIRGEQGAMRFYNRQAHIGESAIIGMASSILIFYSLPAPMFNAVILGRFSPKKMQIPEGYDLPYSTTEEYMVGYQKKARNLKIQQSIKWGYIGLGVGLAGFIAYYATGGN
ncbi:MAG: hypothetical protein ABI772_07410 [Bacteroidota bacterium]